jgi:acyl-coenzyme A thioesterase PaaI-like protein
VRCEATVVYSGARMATSEGRLLDGKGRMIAHGSESSLVVEAK